MIDRDFDDGMIHNHHWATSAHDDADRLDHPMVADAAAVPTPSSVTHDDLMEISR